MAYTAYLQRMLEPLGVYALSDSSISGAAVAALGEALDELWTQLQESLAEAFPQSAQSFDGWERLLRLRLPQETIAQRRCALTALLANSDAVCSIAALSQLLTAWGCPGTLSLNGSALTITTPQLADEETLALSTVLRRVIPAQLLVSVQTES